MKNFYLLNKAIVMRINKQIRIAALEIVSGLIIIFIASIIPGVVGNLVKKYLIFIALAVTILIIILNFILLYRNSPRDRETLMSIDDSKIVLKSRSNQREFYVMGMAYVELDTESYRPGVLVTFIYSETNQFTVMIHSNQYNEFLATMSSLKIHVEKKRNP